MSYTQKDRRKKISKPRIFNEQRESMLLIETATTTDMYIWCLSVLFMFCFLSGMIFYAMN